MVCAIRGATTIKSNKVQEIECNSVQLIRTILERNPIANLNNIVSILFSCTKDVTAAYPAKFLRNIGFEHIPMFCVQEMYVEGSLPMCIRVLVTIDTDDKTADNNAVTHVYLNDAKILRPDLA